MALLHFETDKYQRNSTFLQDAEYGRALDTFVKGAQAWLAPFKHHLRKIRACAAETGAQYTGCVDVLLVSEVHEVLLLKRRVHPQPDWWFIGALLSWSPEANSLCLTDVLAGDTPLDTAVATVRRETKLELPRERFSFVCLASYLWQFRQQEPQGSGTADIALIFQGRVTAAEQRVVLWSYDRAEYEAARWLPIEAAAADASLHPAVRSALLHVSLREAEAAMDAAQADDAALLRCARKLCAARQRVDAVAAMPYANVRCYASRHDTDQP